MVHVGIEDGSDRIVGLAMWMLFTLKPEERPEPMGVDLAKNSVVEGLPLNLSSWIISMLAANHTVGGYGSGTATLLYSTGQGCGYP